MTFFLCVCLHNKCQNLNQVGGSDQLKQDLKLTNLKLVKDFFFFLSSCIININSIQYFTTIYLFIVVCFCVISKIMYSPLIISKQTPSEKGQGYILCFHYTVNPVHPMQSYTDLILCKFEEQTLHKNLTLH